jgi:hypothetical protein
VGRESQRAAYRASLGLWGGGGEIGEQRGKGAKGQEKNNNAPCPIPN